MRRTHCDNMHFYDFMAVQQIEGKEKETVWVFFHPSSCRVLFLHSILSGFICDVASMPLSKASLLSYNTFPLILPKSYFLTSFSRSRYTLDWNTRDLQREASRVKRQDLQQQHSGMRMWKWSRFHPLFLFILWWPTIDSRLLLTHGMNKVWEAF